MQTHAIHAILELFEHFVKLHGFPVKCVSLAVFREFADSLDKRKKSSKVCKDNVHCSLTYTILSIRKSTGDRNGHSSNHRHKSVQFNFDI